MFRVFVEVKSIPQKLLNEEIEEQNLHLKTISQYITFQKKTIYILLYKVRFFALYRLVFAFIRKCFIFIFRRLNVSRSLKHVSTFKEDASSLLSVSISLKAVSELYFLRKQFNLF